MWILRNICFINIIVESKFTYYGPIEKTLWSCRQYESMFIAHISKAVRRCTWLYVRLGRCDHIGLKPILNPNSPVWVQDMRLTWVDGLSGLEIQLSPYYEFHYLSILSAFKYEDLPNLNNRFWPKRKPKIPRH